jgi:hypothetical protein
MMKLGDGSTDGMFWCSVSELRESKVSLNHYGRRKTPTVDFLSHWMFIYMIEGVFQL